MVPRDELFRRVWQTTTATTPAPWTCTFPTCAAQIEPDPRHPTLILTERGVGYRLTLTA